ncbi:unnamed protein product [Rotaria socialis]|uniref:Mos1 transposase HTH domain-containing protein n=1 Tax=Rotaria socialis TaxID=392032 RepID=A0A821DAU9_9BILA|nr:unnamed protein product [Rotaria socialis]CAF4491875.1 unnamed protein product [Rotaria socialis]CAF4533964.1 unnamed protein product [Rotaria socialis]CAF4618620.1 unnamed protein product [Rotaria socialis]
MNADHETEMNLSRREIRGLLLLEFLLDHKTAEATNNICRTMGQDIISTRTAQRRLNQLNSGNFELGDSSRSGRPVEVDLDRLKQLIEDDPRLTTRCLAEKLGCSHTTVETYLNKLGKTWKYGVWIPHKLSAHQLQYRIDIYLDLLTSHRHYE